MANILGITGAIGSGKTTFSRMLAELGPNNVIYESGQLVADLANDFNKALSEEISFELTGDETEIVNQALVWLAESINEKLHQDISWSDLAITRRRLAAHGQHYAKLFTYLEQIKKEPTVAKQPITAENKQTYRALLQWLGGHLVLTINKTVWFDAIFQRIKQHDTNRDLIIINGLRFPADAETVRQHQGLIAALKRPQTASDTQDITEANRNKIKPDTTIKNRGDLAALQSIAEELYSDLKADKLQKQYG